MNYCFVAEPFDGRHGQVCSRPTIKERRADACRAVWPGDVLRARLMKIGARVIEQIALIRIQVRKVKKPKRRQDGQLSTASIAVRRRSVYFLQRSPQGIGRPS